MRRLAIISAKAYLVTVVHFNAVETIGEDIVFAVTQAQGETTGHYAYAAQTALQISTLPLGFSIFTNMVAFRKGMVMEHLAVFQQAHIIPGIIYFSGKGQTSTETMIYMFVTGRTIINLTMAIMITDSASNLHVVSFLFQSCYANTQGIQFVCKFCSQFVYVSAFGHCFRYDLSHFITGHQTVAAEGIVAITFDYASSCQFGDAVIGPVASRYIGERVGSISRSGYA